MNLLAGRVSALSIFALAAAGCSSPEPIWATMPLVVPVVGSMTESLSVNSLTVAQGGSASLTVTITPAGGFSGLVQFAPVGGTAGLGLILSPESVDIAGTEPVQIPMTISAGITSTAGTQAITLAAASSNQAAEAALNLTVTAVVLEATPTSLTFASASSDPAQTVIASETNYTGTFSETDTCTGIAAISQPTPGTFSVAPTAAGSCVMTLADTNGRTLAVPITVSAD